MQFLINVLPNNHLTNHKLKLLIENIAYQNNSNVQLIIKKSFINHEMIDFLSHASLKIQIVNHYSDVSLDKDDSYYWINLKDNDCLLPSAIDQWQSVLCRHPSSELWLHSLKNEKSFNQQMNYLIKKADHAKRNTIQNLFYQHVQLKDLSLKQKLAISFGLQEYNILKDTDRFDFLSQSADMNLNQILFKCNLNTLQKFDPSKFTTILHLMLDHQEILSLQMPTVAISLMKLNRQMEWLNQVFTGMRDIGDANFLGSYHVFAANQIKNSLLILRNSKLNRSKKRKILDRIIQYNQKLPYIFRIKNISKMAMGRLTRFSNQLLSKKGL
ncbi:hypothetical protein WR164_09120 [Philodulcilactobacillus myokoensis]|uniref:Uncharacterized protein n=1 Tax=Philodulcilactobacillus myokoensis TaxID=2929573 RepID=A0A9W6B1Y9_9LACO|nr:hypothetical protein [Philodulcilactobacillus myokoensis]GLB46933.1 hypothetical protein WR164_09120 [Philodulcilactobacillus myokoensis]